MRETERRHDVAGTVFSLWIVLGLFLDGWAHNAGKPEDFWTPWHAVLYSGFAAAVLWFSLERSRRRRRGEDPDDDPLVILGFVAFAIAGLGDAVWHTMFGVEEDVAALLSPTHLALMVGGIVLITAPLRRLEDATVPEGWRRSYPTVAAITLTTALVAFFLQFASPFHILHSPERYAASGTEADHVLGVVGILVTNALLVAAVGWADARRRLPTGAGTTIVGGTALLVAGLSGFDRLELVAAALAGGAAFDLALYRGARLGTALVVLPAVLWPAWFGIYHLRWGLGWPVEYWPGTVVFALLTAGGVGLLVETAPRSAPDPAAEPSPLARDAGELATSTSD